jgi:hypothetical protein
MKPQAMRPGFFNMPIKEEVKVEGKATDEERDLQALSVSRGWAVLSEFIDRLIKDLDGVTEQSMINGLPLDEIGKNAIVASQSKAIINRIKNKVLDAKKAVERLNE